MQTIKSIISMYIDKDALVAEIERRRDLHFKNYLEKGFESSEGKYDEDKYILSFLDTLEVKEANLEKHLKEDIEDVFFDLNGVAVKGATSYLTVKDVKDIAKHFFELGLKSQKGE